MIQLALLFLLVSIVAGTMGFTNVSVRAAQVSKVLFVIFLVLFVLALILGVTVFRGLS